MNINIYSLMPCLNTEVGHIYAYNHSLATSLKLNGWNHIGVIPKECTIDTLPKHWLKLFTSDHWDADKPFHLRVVAALKNIPPFIRLFKRIKKSLKTPSILFIEHGLHHLLGCIVALMTINPDIEIWIVHRYDYQDQPFRAKIFKLFHRLLKWRLGKNRVKLLTDSELLAQTQTKLFQSQIHLLPIPHTPAEKIHQPRQANSKLLLWWPGGSIREDKGLKDIQKLADHLTESTKLILADKAKPLFNRQVHINFIETILTRLEYEKWMYQVDFVLLPYLPSIYHSSTSGIFVEAIVAGSIPITTAGTWMAHELQKHHLSELILDWDKPIVNRLHAIKEDAVIDQKLKNMQHSYQEFHSIEGFANSMKSILTC